MMMSLVCLGFVGVAWALLGYSLAFCGGGGALGDLGFALLSGVGLEAKGAIPHLLFMAYQGTFAIITAALSSYRCSSPSRSPSATKDWAST